MSSLHLLQRSIKKDVIVVSGLPRSGTSMMMQMLDAAGIEVLTDGLRVPDASNPRGYYELEHVKDLQSGDTAWLRGAEGKAVKVISALLIHLPAGPAYKVVFMERNLEETVLSQERMLERRGEVRSSASREELHKLLSGHLNEVKQYMKSRRDFHVHYVEFNTLLHDPISELQPLGEFLGVSLPFDRMIEHIDLGLYRNRAQTGSR